jgi:hypothetical protein
LENGAVQYTKDRKKNQTLKSSKPLNAKKAGRRIKSRYVPLTGKSNKGSITAGIQCDVILLSHKMAEV